VICAHSEICSVCSWIHLPTEEQKQLKVRALISHLEGAGIKLEQTPKFLSVADEALRDRADLVWADGKLGFYQKQEREVFQIEKCPLMSPHLAKFFEQIRKISFPIRKGSLRLRVSPDGERRGVWLDFANEDIRDLLSERKTLESLLELGVVEIGQRRKSLSREMKLQDPQFHKWTRTWTQDQAIDLYSVIGGFTQSGDLANRTLIIEMQKLFQETVSQNWVEFGCGNGNLTLPLVATHPENRVKALEFDELSLEGLKLSLEAHPTLAKRIELVGGDFQRKTAYAFRPDESILVNPPRSGLMKFLDPLFELSVSQRPTEFIYMSCHLESFAKDAARMKALGYDLQEISIVDQFPHSVHFEILSLWNLSDV
jgi:23S rRNA (uracil1939-C5)-methyltransferase